MSREDLAAAGWETVATWKLEELKARRRSTNCDEMRGSCPSAPDPEQPEADEFSCVLNELKAEIAELSELPTLTARKTAVRPAPSATAPPPAKAPPPARSSQLPQHHPLQIREGMAKPPPSKPGPECAPGAKGKGRAQDQRLNLQEAEDSSDDDDTSTVAAGERCEQIGRAHV